VPTSHLYLNNRSDFTAPAPRSPVFAPADGQVDFVFRSGSEAKVGVRSGAFTYHLAHVELDSGIAEGARVTAGQRIGIAGATTVGIDFGLINRNLDVFFANPSRYPDEDRHGDAPLRYFEEPLRSELYARVRRLGSERDGKFDFDQAGRLAGNWFLEGLAPAATFNADGWPKHLAFVYDNYDPASIRVSVGGTLPLVGAFAVQAGAIDPRDVSPSSGKVTYRLLGAPPGSAPGPQVGVLIVEMLDAGRIRVEMAVGQSVTTHEFTSAARIYVR
jgi:hypothetical protein